LMREVDAVLQQTLEFFVNWCYINPGTLGTYGITNSISRMGHEILWQISEERLQVLFDFVTTRNGNIFLFYYESIKREKKYNFIINK
jgi:hypothetical protein